VSEFWRLVAGVELAFVVFEEVGSSGRAFLDALGDPEPGEKCYLVDATTVRGRCHDYFLVHSPVEKRIDPNWEAKRRLPFALAVIPGVGLISSASEVAQVSDMVRYARKEKSVFRRGKERLSSQRPTAS
jgi:hypothetical protein